MTLRFLTSGIIQEIHYPFALKHLKAIYIPIDGTGLLFAYLWISCKRFIFLFRSLVFIWKNSTAWTKMAVWNDRWKIWSNSIYLSSYYFRIIAYNGLPSCICSVVQLKYFINFSQILFPSLLVPISSPFPFSYNFDIRALYLQSVIYPQQI